METEPFLRIKLFAAVFLAWFIAQLIKLIRGFIVEKRFNFKYFLLAGGMPSSHSAVVTSLTTGVALYYGIDSVFFLITLIFSLITMFDAAGVRRAVGRQAITLNKIVDEFYQGGQVKEDRVKELLGHTPTEVIAGAFLGVLIAFAVCW